MKIMAIDPGVSTGWAIGVVDTEAKTCYLDKHGWTPWQEFVLTFHHRMVGDDPFPTVIYESWLLRKNKALTLAGSDMPSSQCIGAIRLSCWLAGAMMVVQHPDHKTPANAWIKAKGLYLPESDVEHNRDAIRHLYYYCITNDIEVLPHGSPTTIPERTAR